MGEPERRRRRLRPPSAGAAPTPAPPPGGPPVPPAEDVDVIPAVPAPAVVTQAIEDSVDATAADATETAEVADTGPRPARPGGSSRPPRARPTSGAGAGSEDREMERGLRGLVGSGSSQVSVGAALRARDAARPTDEHLIDAEANLAIVRRNWLPREDLPRNR